MPLTLQQATTDPYLHRRLLDTHRQVWISLWWGQCFFLLGPGAHKVWFVSSRSLTSPVLCKFWLLCGGVNGDLLQEDLCHTQDCCIQSPCPYGRPLLTRTSTGDIQILKGTSGSVFVGSPGVHKVLFEPSKRLWCVWDLILNVISPLLPSCWGFSFAPECGLSFFGGIQHSSVDGCSAVSCNFGVHRR